MPLQMILELTCLLEVFTAVFMLDTVSGKLYEKEGITYKQLGAGHLYCNSTGFR